MTTERECSCLHGECDACQVARGEDPTNYAGDGCTPTEPAPPLTQAEEIELELEIGRVVSHAR